MNIAYSQPLTRAWERTRRTLFRAADWPERWFTIGFAAFLAGLVGYGTSWQYEIGPWGDHDPSIREFTRGLVADPALIALLGTFAIFGIAAWVVLLWVSSRAKFVFLDDVVHERPAIVDPWRRFREAGNSLFVWRLVFSLIALAMTVIVVGPPLLIGGAAAWAGSWWGWGAGGVFLAVLMGMLLGVVVAYVHCFLDNFIVPIMYRDGVSAMDAWRRFVPLLRERPAEFLLFGVLLLVLAMVTAVAIGFAAVFLTCCIGFFVLAIPYLGTVVLLPVWVTYRGFGPEFLAQFGPTWSVFPEREAPPSDEGPPAPPDTTPPFIGQGI